MKVLMINGSAHERGSTYTALAEAAKVLEAAGIETEIVFLGNEPIRDCTACGSCRNLDNACIFDDDCVNRLTEKAAKCDGFVFGTPVYYAHPTGRILCTMDRMFRSAGAVFNHKPAFVVASARRSGTTASFDVLNKYLTLAQMPVVSANYWNNIHGNNAFEASQDKEGLRTIRNAARNMIWLLKCIELGQKNGISAPVAEQGEPTNFIR